MMQKQRVIKKQKRKSLLKEIVRHRNNYLFMAPFLIVFFTFTILPVVMSMGLSFTYFNVLEAPQWIGLRNYFKLFLNDPLFLKALSNTVVLAVITGPVGYMLSLFMAWVLNEFSPIIRAILTIIFYTPSLCGGTFVIWALIYSGDQYGLLNGLLMSLDVIYSPIQWLSDANYMMPAAIIVILWTSFGTGFLSFIAGIQGVDKTMYEAGALDGVRNRWQELWYITLPSMKPQLMFGAVMSITGAFGIGDLISGLFGFPSVGYVLYTLVHELQDYGNTRFDMGYASAIATVLFLIMVLLNKFIQKLLAKVGE